MAIRPTKGGHPCRDYYLEVVTDEDLRLDLSQRALIDRYTQDEMSVTIREDTASAYRGILKNWIKPKWGSQSLESIKTMAVENWLKGIPRSPNTKAHIRNLMHLLFNCAIRWELVDRNPIQLVRQLTKRIRVPRVRREQLLEAARRREIDVVLVC